jgi:hypothetical protein
LATGGAPLLSAEGLAHANEHRDTPLFDEILGYHSTFTNCGWADGRFLPGWLGWDGAGEFI